ncbi:MAG: hypothetical protein N2114_00555 [Candidatus Goldbacteria bacterium]|nr:hypothetical protein [Candidatus Goldiibacteriota bacterium]
MKNFFIKMYNYWLAIGLFIGNIISTIILFIFYYTIFAIFAIPYKIFKYKNWTLKNKNSSWINKIKNISKFEDFITE